MMKLNVTPGQAAAYMMLPRIIPRLHEIGFQFHFVAYLMALIYASVGLLSKAHPFLNPANIGSYSVRQVFIEAAFNIRFRWKNLDQIVLFFLLLAAFVLLLIQFALMCFYLTTGVAHAIGFGSMFDTPIPDNDIALMLLDRVFGVPGFFRSCISELAITCQPTGQVIIPTEPLVYPEPRHLAMQSLFAFYSYGMLLVGTVILLYFILAVFFETVQSGVPFGRRFATFYAPIRLCLAILMLMPLPLGGLGPGATQVGYNAAQYLTLFVARAGSGFGTNIWNAFNNYYIFGGQGVAAPNGFGMLSIGSPGTGAGNTPAAQLVGVPRASKVDPLVSFMHVAHSCRAMIKRMESRNIEAFLVRSFNPNGAGAYLPLTNGTTFTDALDFNDNGTILVRFGAPTPNQDDIREFCGEIALPVGDLVQPGARWLYEQHFLMIAQMWTDQSIVEFGDRIAAITLPGANKGCAVPLNGPNAALWGAGATACDQFPDPAYYIQTRDKYQGIVNANVVEARTRQITIARPAIDLRILTRGWAGAGIWYKRLAEINGSLFDAAHALPDIRRMPMPMVSILLQNAAATQRMTAQNKYTQQTAKDFKDTATRYREIAKALNQVYKYFLTDAFNRTLGNNNTGSAIYDLMNFLFGTEALFDMRFNTEINPLVQLIGIGKSIVDRTIINLMWASGMEFAGGVMAQLDDWSKAGEGILKVTDAWFTVCMIALGIGIIMYYVLPFLPFLYFFFSVIKWLQSIFEAMIGMPLWALAHLRIDGDGLPGPAAENGYYLLLEILLRPALTIFGMVCSFIIFTAMVYTLNDIFNVVTVNLTGFNLPVNNNQVNTESMRGTVDQFFYTVLYAVLVYIFAVTSFKLIDRIPENILRWMGSGVRNIVDESGDPVPGLIRSTYIGAFGMPLVQKGGEGMLGQAVEGLQGGMQGAGRTVGAAMQEAMKPPK